MAEAPGPSARGRGKVHPSASRLPVRGVRAKRPAAAQEAAEPPVPPVQKRARPGPAAPRPAERVPLRALSVAAAARAVPPQVPRKATATGAAPRGGAAPPSRPSKRPHWDLKGQLGDLRVALDASRSRAEALQRENQALQLQLGRAEEGLVSCREEMGRMRREHEEELGKNKEQHEEEVARMRKEHEDELGRMRKELGTVTQELGDKVAQAEAKILDLTNRLEEKEAQLQQAQQQLQQREERLQALDVERRSLHNALQELKGNVRVFCRVRPLLPEEAARQAGMEHLSFPPGDQRTLLLHRHEESRVGRDGSSSVRHEFSFDRVFPPGATQREVFDEVSALVQSALDGFHVCIFAYGQTGSGKTYTLEGPDPCDPQAAGLAPRAVRLLFQRARELAQEGWQYEFCASYLEIYNESLRDLLAAPGEPPAELGIRRVSAASEELHVPNLRRLPVRCHDEVLQLLQRAGAQRAVARTGSNERSSRSHGVFQLHIRGSNPRRDVSCASVLSLVDLAGSERLEKGGAPGGRLRETQAINSSLSALGLVILALSRKEPHVPYRNSKLTYLLQNSLGGSAKMLMIVNISPLEENFCESLSSLRFASKVNECVIGTARANWK
ncbi:kinesin-like protein KIFC1 isoform X1 [Patagioenas fasciata]|uniref:kinesin-like protein KIFC1 isoform X1 n=1 Tax=Patagioenas fasciata TaxID=372321 RepID=UPI003A997AC7